MSQQARIELNEKYKPLFTSKKRYFLVTGGRGSAKSFGVSTTMTFLTEEVNHKILFTRWTMKSASDSIIPEFTDKISRLQWDSKFKIDKTDIENRNTRSSVMFRGIKTSEGIQTANLKSIEGVTTWVVDEAEELADEEIFNKIDLSIRVKETQNRIVIVLNPTTRLHWIWRRFFENTHRIEMIDGCPVPISTHPDVEHIHTTYLDNVKHLSESYLKIIADIKQNDQQRYAGEIIGGWKIDLDGVLFKRNELKRFSMKDFKLEGLEAKMAYCDVADEGTDAYALMVGYVFKQRCYIVDVIFSYDNIDVTKPRTVAMFMKHDIDLLRVESNNQGSLLIKNLRELLGSRKILNVNNSTNKHTRIILGSGFIKEYFYFLDQSEIKSGSDYDLFMREMFDYMKKKGETKDKDDAPDCASGLAKFIENAPATKHLFSAIPDYDKEELKKELV